jgi:predicted transcriptional regulator
MAKVLLSIQSGHETIEQIQQDTRIDKKKLTAAIANLAYIGAIKTRQRNDSGKAVYKDSNKTQLGCPKCLKGVSSIFSPKVSNYQLL